MIPSVVVNLAEAAFTCAAFVRYCKSSPPKIMLRYFTTLSNLFCAAACLLTAVFRLCGGAPKAVLLLKFVGTAAVSVTCLTVVSEAGGEAPVDLGALNLGLVMDNRVVFGTVNANRRHYLKAAAALAKADTAWLDKMITRRVPLADYVQAFEEHDDDVKVVLDLA